MPRFTQQAEETIARSQEILFRYQHLQMELEHVLLALLKQPEGTVSHILVWLGADINLMMSRVDDILRTKARSDTHPPPFFVTPAVEYLAELVQEEADRLNDELVSTEHILLGLVDVASKIGSPLARLFSEFKITRSGILQGIGKVRGASAQTKEDTLSAEMVRNPVLALAIRATAEEWDIPRLAEELSAILVTSVTDNDFLSAIESIVQLEIPAEVAERISRLTIILIGTTAKVRAAQLHLSLAQAWLPRAALGELERGWFDFHYQAARQLMPPDDPKLQQLAAALSMLLSSQEASIRTYQLIGALKEAPDKETFIRSHLSTFDEAVPIMRMMGMAVREQGEPELADELEALIGTVQHIRQAVQAEAIRAYRLLGALREAPDEDAFLREHDEEFDEAVLSIWRTMAEAVRQEGEDEFADELEALIGAVHHLRGSETPSTEQPPEQRADGLAVFAQDSDSPESIQIAVQAFIKTDDLDQLERVIAQYPELLTDAADALLDQMLDEARARNSEEHERLFTERRALLSRCRQIGIQAAFAEKMSENATTPFDEKLSHQILKSFLSIPPELQDIYFQTMETYRRHDLTNNRTALDEAATGCEYILKHPAFEKLPQATRLLILNSAGRTFVERYQAYGQQDDLNKGLSFLKQAVALTSSEPVFLFDLFNNLGMGLKARYALTGEFDDLQEAIRAYQQAIEFIHRDHPELPKCLGNLSNALRQRYIRTNAVADLQKSITLHQQAIDLTPEDSDELPYRFYNLSASLGERYRVTGNLDDLQEIIKICQRVVELTPDNSPDLFRYLNNLGVALRERYLHSGDLDDLQQAIMVCQRAVDLTPQNAPELSRHLNNLGLLLGERYEQTGNLADLEQAIRLSQQVVDKCSKGSPDLPGYLNNLASNLRRRYLHADDLPDLEAVIEAYQQALELMPDTSPYLSRCLDNLANGFSDRYERTSNIHDLWQEIDLRQKAVKLIPLGSPEEPVPLVNLGNGLRRLYNRTQNPQDMQKSQDIFRDACRKGMTTAVAVALRSSLDWGNWALSRKAWGEASEAYDYGFNATATLFKTQLLRESKENWLTHAQNLSPRAAYALARNNDWKGAVLALEQGRARLLSEALGLQQADLAELESNRPDLFNRYRQLTNRLAALQHQELQRSHAFIAGERRKSYPIDLANQIREVDQKIDLLIEEIRQVDGYQEFLQPPTFAEIRAVAEHAPLVYLSVTEVGGLALIVQAKGEITPVWLDNLTEKALSEQVNVHRWVYNTPDFSTDIRDKVIGNVMDWLWDVLMGPLVKQIVNLSNKKEIDRVVLIPQGLLGLLPLHAARTKEPTTSTEYRYALDIIRVTYAPNARALTAAREKANIPPDTLFAVDNPDGSLHFSKPEVMAAGAHFEQKSILDHKTATRQAVQEELPSYSVLHFSTHGWAGWDDSLSSGLKLAKGEEITLRDIFALRLDKARLAVLSACETGIPGTKLPDEVISLPTGLVEAGVPCVVASLWAVPDISTALLMERFYHNHRKGSMDFVAALHEAQKWVRQVPIGEVAKYAETCYQQFKWDKKAKVELFKLMRNYRYRALQNPNERPFAHPYYWTAFTVNGM